MNLTPSALLVLAGLAGLPALQEYRRSPVSTLRQGAPGRFASLGLGSTHYDWIGPERGPVTVCVHGLTTPSYIFRPLARQLAAQGQRVLIYDLYGRGFSDAPRGRQTAEFFTRQLAELLAHEGVNDDFSLVGYSMGGVIASSYAAAESQRLNRLVLLAPAGMGHDLGPLARRVLDWPLLGDWIFHMAWPRGFRQAARAAPDTLAEQQMAELQRRGFVSAVLSSLRHALRDRLEAPHRAIAGTSLPVTAIWGREDRTIPLRALGQLSQWNRAARLEVIDDATHLLPWTHADRIAEIIRDTAALPKV